MTHVEWGDTKCSVHHDCDALLRDAKLRALPNFSNVSTLRRRTTRTKKHSSAAASMMRITSSLCPPCPMHRELTRNQQSYLRNTPSVVGTRVSKTVHYVVTHLLQKNVIPPCVTWATAKRSQIVHRACAVGMLRQRISTCTCDTSSGAGSFDSAASQNRIEPIWLPVQFLHMSCLRASVRSFTESAAPGSSCPINSVPHRVITHAVDAHFPEGSEDSNSPTDEKLTANDYETRLRKKMRSTGPRPAVLHRLQDPLSVHLYRVAASRPYRWNVVDHVPVPGAGERRRPMSAGGSTLAGCMCAAYRRTSRESVLVTGSTLVKELRKHFRCKRVLIGHRTKLSEVQTDQSTQSSWPGFPPLSVVSATNPKPYVQTEIYRASDRILKKLAGLHSYSDGILAEMQLPPETHDFGDIKLMLCLGDLPPAQELDKFSRLVDFPKSSKYSNASAVGMYGTLLRSAAALHWQGVWILPRCPDVFSPLGIRASQGALFWMPYRTGSWEALQQFARERQLLLCVPHHKGVDPQAPDLLGRKAKGICLVVDAEAHSAAQKMENTHSQAVPVHKEHIFAEGRNADSTRRSTERSDIESVDTDGSPSSDYREMRRHLPPCFVPDRLLSVAPPSSPPACAEAVRACNVSATNCSASSTSARTNGSVTSGDLKTNSVADCRDNLGSVTSLQALDEIKCMHPLTMYTLLMYQLKRTHFPSTSASSYIFSVRKKQKNVTR